jgi:two-component system cell cycle response regulator
MGSKDSSQPKAPHPRTSGWEYPDEETTGVTSLSPEARALLAQVQTRKACLILLTGGGNIGETYNLAEGETVLGRGNQAQVRIAGEGISRRHARLLQAGNQVVIEDLESSNGTFVNDERITRKELADGDKIRLASTAVLKFTYQDRLDEAFQKQMFDAALRDGLTHAFNKKYILDRLNTELAYARRHQSSLTFLMIDLDHFKQINDRYGHLAGDRVLAQVTKVATATLRAEDVFGRYGGEEFCVICRGITPVQAGIMAERLRSSIANTVVEYDGTRISVTTSVGVATFPQIQADSVNALVSAADEALYEAKAAGRNRVMLAR